MNQLADADVFGVGLYHPERHEIEYRLAIEKGKRYAPYSRDTTRPRPAAGLVHRAPRAGVHQRPVGPSTSKYITRYDEQSRQLEDGSMSQQPQSIIYLPLVAKDRVLGIITIQSFEKHAYTEHHLNVLQSLASYTAIALDNANAYRQLNEQEHEIRRLFEEAEQARADRRGGRRRQERVPLDGQPRAAHAAHLGARLRQDHQEAPRGSHLPAGARPTTARSSQTIQQVEDNLKVVVSEGERLTKLIDDVLDLAKIEAGKLEWHMET